MDKLNHYRQLIRECLIPYLDMKPSGGEIEVYQIFDLKMTVIKYFMLAGMAFSEYTEL